MIQTLGHRSHFITKLLVIAAVVYAVKNSGEIREFLGKNQTIREVAGGWKWLAEEMRPPTEAEKAQHKAWAAEQRKRGNDLKAEGINPYVEYATPADGKKWEEAKAGYREIMKAFDQKSNQH